MHALIYLSTDDRRLATRQRDDERGRMHGEMTADVVDITMTKKKINYIMQRK